MKYQKINPGPGPGSPFEVRMRQLTLARNLIFRSLRPVQSEEEQQQQLLMPMLMLLLQLPWQQCQRQHLDLEVRQRRMAPPTRSQGGWLYCKNVLFLL